MKGYFRNRAIPPLNHEQLISVGLDPDDLWWSPTFHTWVFSGPIVQQHPYKTTGAIIALLGLKPHPDA